MLHLRYYIKILSLTLAPETMKLLQSTENKITKNKNSKNIPRLELTEVVLVHCNIVNNSYQQNSGVLYTFVPNKSFDQFHPEKLFKNLLIQSFNLLTYGLLIINSQPLEVEDKINITLVIN